MTDIQTIELDCPPGDPRPGDLIAGVVKGTSIANDPRALPDATTSRLFGCWTWDFKHVPAEEWRRIRDVIRPRIEELVKTGVCRYGSW